MGDRPWCLVRQLGPETTASMSVIAARLRSNFPQFPIGVQILAGANKEALSVAVAAGNSSF